MNDETKAKIDLLKQKASELKTLKEVTLKEEKAQREKTDNILQGISENSSKSIEVMQSLLATIKNSEDISDIKELLNEKFDLLQKTLSKDNYEEMRKAFDNLIISVENIKLEAVDYDKLKEGLIASVEGILKVFIDVNEEPNEITIDWNARLNKPSKVVEIYSDYKITRTIEYNAKGNLFRITNKSTGGFAR